jgi:hypothetical protein
MDSTLDKRMTLGFLGTALEPVIRLMLRTGVTWREFSELAKTKFVDVATADFGIRGRPTNVSRVAILTGLDRRDVAKLRKAVPAALTKGYQSKASQVLSAWHHEPDFLDADGRPAALAVDGEGATFTELMRRYAPALPVIAMIKELSSAQAIAEGSDDRLRALKRAYLPSDVSAERLRLWSSVLSDVANTIEHNLSRGETALARFERRALNLRVDRKALPEFREFVEREGQALLERLDDWLAAHEVPSDEAEDGIRLGVGVYHIQDRVERPTRMLRSHKSAGETQ